MNLDEEQPSVAAAAAAADNGNAAEDMELDVAYIDRIVRGVDAEANLSAERCGDDEEDSEEGSIFSLDEEDMESDEASVSDDDFEDDADEDDIAVRIMPKNYTPLELRGELSEDSKALLLWRSDKEESFSDWSIEVIVAKIEGERHQNNLPRASVCASSRAKEEWLLRSPLQIKPIQRIVKQHK